MKGSLTLVDKPFRYGGFWHDYDSTNDDWQEKVWSKAFKAPVRCWCCNGVMRNIRSVSGTLLKASFPYIGEFRIIRGKDKGKFHFKILCRSCAYRYGRGVVEMDAETYKKSSDFDEMKYKEWLKKDEAVIVSQTG